MKKIIIVLVIFCSSFSYSQCELKLVEIINSLSLNESEFETLAFKKGFSFDYSLGAFLCDIAFVDGSHAQLERKYREGILNVGYTFTSKLLYLAFKEELELRGKTLEVIKLDYGQMRNYIYSNKLVSILNNTYVGENKKINFYSVIVSRAP
jgi:hypothetical protein